MLEKRAREIIKIRLALLTAILLSAFPRRSFPDDRIRKEHFYRIPVYQQQLMDSALLEVTTGRDERTFLQAWANKTPIVSFQVDPSGIFSSRNAGLIADGSIEHLCKQIETLATEQAEHKGLTQAGWSYLREHHSVEAITDQYEKVFGI